MGIENAQLLMNNWLIAGILAVASTTTTMGAFGVMVEDKAKKIYKDFYSSPITRASITGGYLTSAFIIGVLMSSVALAIGQIFIIIQVWRTAGYGDDHKGIWADTSKHNNKYCNGWFYSFHFSTTKIPSLRPVPLWVR